MWQPPLTCGNGGLTQVRWQLVVGGRSRVRTGRPPWPRGPPPPSRVDATASSVMCRPTAWPAGHVVHASRLPGEIGRGQRPAVASALSAPTPRSDSSYCSADARGRSGIGRSGTALPAAIRSSLRDGLSCRPAEAGVPGEVSAMRGRWGARRTVFSCTVPSRRSRNGGVRPGRGAPRPVHRHVRRLLPPPRPPHVRTRTAGRAAAARGRPPPRRGAAAGRPSARRPR